MATTKAGKEVDAYCTKCRMTLAHTVLALLGTKIARVQCNTCGGQHAYRAEPGARTPASPRAPKPRKEVITFEQRLTERDPATAKRYSPRESFPVDALVDHPTFGLGFVLAVRQDKIDVAFKGFEKTLICGRGEAASAKPAFAPPAPRESGPADKPASVEEAAAVPAASEPPPVEPA